MVIRPERWLEPVLGSPNQIRVLRVLARDPSKAWTERAAAAEARLAPSTANLAFRNLYATGLLEVRRVGRSHLVRLRTDFELAHQLIRLFKAEARTLDRALEAAARRMPQGIALYAFGSTVRGEATAESDVDLLVVAPTAELAESAATDAWDAVRRVLPARVEALALDKTSARRPRYRRLLENVRREGRQLTPVGLEEAMG